MPRRANIRPDEPGRDKILDAGRAVFGARGFDATSIAQIGQEAGIAKSVLYHYFGSKAGLYEAILDQDAQGLIAAVAAAVPRDRRATPRLRPGVDAFLAYLADHRDSWRLLTRDAPADPDVQAIHERIDDAISSSLRRLLALPAKARAKPHLVDLVALAVRTYAAWWYGNPEVPRDEVLEAILDVAAAGAKRMGQQVRTGA